MVWQVVPLQPMESDGRADTYFAAHEGSHATAGQYALKEAAACGEDQKAVLELQHIMEEYMQMSKGC